MYIEFQIPMDLSNPGFALLRVRKDMSDWSSTHGIMYHEKLVKSTLKVTFEDQKTYSFFALTWEPKYTNIRYRLVEPMSKPID